MIFVMTVCAHATFAQLIQIHTLISIYITYTPEDKIIIYWPFVNKNIKYVQ